MKHTFFFLRRDLNQMLSDSGHNCCELQRAVQPTRTPLNEAIYCRYVAAANKRDSLRTPQHCKAPPRAVHSM
jgi:hypothetical protein